jgi:hypothetical protein
MAEEIVARARDDARNPSIKPFIFKDGTSASGLLRAIHRREAPPAIPPEENPPIG